MNLDAHGRLDARHHRVGAGLDVEQDLGAEGLDHVDDGVERVVRGIAAGGQAQVFRPDADRHRLPRIRLQALGAVGWDLHAEAGRLRPQRAAVLDPGLDEVHGRRADEAGHEAVGRLRVELEGLAHLLHPAVFHHDDPIAERHGLDLVVGHVDGGGLEAVVQALELDAHLHPELGVQVGQRLVEQEHLGMADDGASDRDALALAARELARLALEQLLDAEDLGRLVDAFGDLGLGELAHLEPERHVVVHGHVRVQRVVLEHHRDVAVLRGQIVDHPLADRDLPGGDLLQAGDHAERGRLAASRRPDEDDELLVADVQVDVLDGVDFVVLLVQIFHEDLRHRDLLYPLTEPVSPVT